jgi:peptidoglycan hydrolase FlgJ
MTAPVNNFYADFKGLASLKNEAAQKDPNSLREAARQFESLFTQMMLKSMREATRSFRSNESFTESDQTDFYREMFDNQMALQMSKGRGLGLADVLVRQLQGGITPKVEGAAERIELKPLDSTKVGVDHGIALPKTPPLPSWKGALNSTGAGFELTGTTQGVSATKGANGEVIVGCAEVDELLNSLPVQDPTDLSRLALQVAQSRTKQLTPARHASPVTLHGSPAVEEITKATELLPNPIATTPNDFITQLWPHAKAAAKELGVDPRMLIAQAALETGWGKSIPCNPDGSCSFNLFGIKAGSRWQGPAVGVNTLEFEGGVAVQRRASFRAYESPAESFRDYALLIKNSPRYAAALGTGSDASAFANALQQGGYATDPNYANKLTAVAERVRVPFKTDSPQPLALGTRVSAGAGGET